MPSEIPDPALLRADLDYAVIRGLGRRVGKFAIDPDPTHLTLAELLKGQQSGLWKSGDVNRPIYLRRERIKQLAAYLDMQPPGTDNEIIAVEASIIEGSKNDSRYTEFCETDMREFKAAQEAGQGFVAEVLAFSLEVTRAETPFHPLPKT